jgi:phage-related holin
MCDKEVVKLHENAQSFQTKMPKILVQRAEEIFPALKENMVSVLCMLGMVSSCSLMIAVAGVIDVIVPRQNWVMFRSVSCC